MPRKAGKGIESSRFVFLGCDLRVSCPHASFSGMDARSRAEEALRAWVVTPDAPTMNETQWLSLVDTVTRLVEASDKVSSADDSCLPKETVESPPG